MKKGFSTRNFPFFVRRKIKKWLIFLICERFFLMLKYLAKGGKVHVKSGGFGWKIMPKARNERY